MAQVSPEGSTSRHGPGRPRVGDGWLAALTSEEYGGSGLPFTAPSLARQRRCTSMPLALTGGRCAGRSKGR